MDFSEFLKQEEELDLIYEAIVDEGVLDGTLRAAKGFVGNLAGQTARGVAGGLMGLGKSAGGLGKIGLGAVQSLTGGAKQARVNIASGASDFVRGVGDTVVGATKAAGALSGVTPTIRAMQAAGEDSLFTPMSNRRTGLQKAMGINSWDPKGDKSKDFEDLKSQYIQARDQGNRNLMRKIRASMEALDAERYKAMVEKGRAYAARKNNERSQARWSKVAGKVGKPNGPEDFLGRLASEG